MVQGDEMAILNALYAIVKFFGDYISFLTTTSTELWLTTLFVAGILYVILLSYLFYSGHANFKFDESYPWIVCIDNREKGKYRIPGGTGTLSLGLVPWILFRLTNDWLLGELARIQFVMAVFGLVILFVQFIKWSWTTRYYRITQGGSDSYYTYHHWVEFVGLRSHFGGCAALAWDPIGFTLYVSQTVICEYGGFEGAKKVLETARDIVALPYTLVGFVPALAMNILTIPFFGKVIVPSFWPKKLSK